MIEEWLARLIELPMGPLALAILTLGALIEYVFPPFPGDTVVLAGAFMVGAGTWSPVGVFAAITAGSLVGVVMTWWFGGWLHTRMNSEDSVPKGLVYRLGQAAEKLEPKFSERPNLYLVINRFLPSIRSLFFVASGYAGIPLPRVLFLGGISMVLWSGLIFAVGMTVGKSWESLLGWFSNYWTVVWVGLLVLATVAIARWLWKRRKPS